MSLKSRCCENPCGIKTCRGCDTCSQAHFEQQHAAARYHLQHAHRALEQLETGFMDKFKAKALEYAQRAANYVNKMSPSTTLTKRKHELEESLKTCTNDTDKLKWSTELDEVIEKLAKLAKLPNSIAPSTAMALEGGTSAQMRTNAYCIG